MEDYLDVNADLYKAFTRDDQYGVLGKKKQPWPERIRLFICAITIVPLRFLGCLYFVTSFYLVCRQVFLSLEKCQVVCKLGLTCFANLASLVLLSIVVVCRSHTENAPANTCPSHLPTIQSQ